MLEFLGGQGFEMLQTLSGGFLGILCGAPNASKPSSGGILGACSTKLVIDLRWPPLNELKELDDLINLIHSFFLMGSPGLPLNELNELNDIPFYRACETSL